MLMLSKTMTKKIKISLIIPAYNEANYIHQCLEYVLKNSHGLLSEIIVVDNASNDKTAEIAKSFSEVQVVREEKKGLTWARTKGWKQARGDVLAYIDADTKMPAGWCEMILSEFSKNENLACLSGPYIYYDVPKWQVIIVKFYWYIFARMVYFFTKYMAVGGNFVISRQTLEKMNGFDTSIQFYGEDTDIARRASKFGKVKFNFNFVMPTSGRRLSGQGLLKTAWLYALNFFSEALFKKPVTKKYRDIR